MNIFNDYLKNLNYILEQGNNRLQKGHSINPKGELFKELNDLFPEDQLLPSLEEFSSMTGMIPNFSQKLGSHPDFSSLKGNSSIENHYIVSMFIDIKGSTNLFKKYHPALVFYISNTIQKVAIHTSLIFGAYVQRLHGDGLFVYFGGKRIAKEVAVQRALQCASVYSYFIKNDLKNLFNEAGIETIYTRVCLKNAF